MERKSKMELVLSQNNFRIISKAPNLAKTMRSRRRLFNPDKTFKEVIVLFFKVVLVSIQTDEIAALCNLARKI